VAARSDLAVTIPSRVVTAFAEGAALVTHPVPFLPPLELYLLRHDRYRGDRALDWLAAQVIDVARKVES
jgi:DNA-binding transcriptional LysR family regulator